MGTVRALDDKKFKRGGGFAHILFTILGRRKCASNVFVTSFEFTGYQVVSYFCPSLIGIWVIRIPFLNYKVLRYAIEKGIFEIIVFHKVDEVGTVQRCIMI